MRMELRPSPRRVMTLKGKTDLHGGSAVRLLEICLVNIYRYAELRRFGK
jgi:hypothetical protein